jgi:predicted PurR-regulated permease PerM
MNYPFFLKLQAIPEFENILEGISNFGNEITNFILATTQNTFMSASRFIIDFIFIIIFLFFFLADGRALIDKIKSVLPIGKTLEAHLFSRLETVIDATIRGNLIVALIEGTFGGILVFVYGFPSPLLLACIMAILSFIPLVGINFVVIPLGLARIISGQVLSGLSMIIISLTLISLSQNVLKPKLVGDRSGLHPLMVLIATIGGLSWFGLVGFVIGPIIAVLFLTSWELFSHEFIKHHANNSEE